MPRIFISYNHSQEDLVHDRLSTCLVAAGATVLLDKTTFRTARQLTREMDRAQDSADFQILVLSDDYFTSPSCRHEMDRALKSPLLDVGRVISVLVTPLATRPRAFDKLRKYIYIDLTVSQPDLAFAWRRLIDTCTLTLGTCPLHWLSVRDTLRILLLRNESANLIITHDNNNRIAWRPLLDALMTDPSRNTHDIPLPMRRVLLSSPRLIPRPSLIADILGVATPLDNLWRSPYDLEQLERSLLATPAPLRLILQDADVLPTRNYGTDFFLTLRHLTTEGSLCLLVVSHVPFDNLLPPDYPYRESPITLTSVRLQCTP